MRIHFFEEFPTEETLAKASSLDFASEVYLGASSWEGYQEAAASLVAINPRCIPAWWPILPRSYWISPFSFPDELEGLFGFWLERPEAARTPLLLDLELPWIRRSMFRQNFRHFRENKRRIEDFFSQASGLGFPLRTAEYPSVGSMSQGLWESLGISYPCDAYPHSKIVMWYTSLIPSGWLGWTKRALLKMRRQYGERLQIGLGTIAPGVFGNEPILSPEDLARDLDWLRVHGFQDVVIFRLDGLEEPYLRVLSSFQANADRPLSLAAAPQTF